MGQRAVIPLAIPPLSGNGNESRYLQECVDTNPAQSAGPFVDRLESPIADVTSIGSGQAGRGSRVALRETRPSTRRLS